MADPKMNVPVMDPNDYRSEVVGGLDRIIRNAFEDGYRRGYAQGEDDAIKRIIEAVRPAANGQSRTTENEAESSRPKAHGYDTHRLIRAVLQEAGATGASPITIARSPLNKHKAGRSGIGKILRRGVKQGQFVAVGDGHYALKAGASK